MVNFSRKTFTSFLLLLVLGCASTSKDFNVNTPEGLYKKALYYAENERYEEAIQFLLEVKNKFPYSKFATQAELKIADLQFERESYAEAESAYKLFKEFHPNHPKIDYVTFRLALSIYKQLPSTIDRDLSLASEAISYFDEVIHSFPQSPWVKKAKEYRNKAYQMLAQKEFYVANFYFKRKHYKSALGRFNTLITKYPHSPLVPQALLKGLISALKIKDKIIAQKYFKILKSQFAQTKEFKKAQKEVQREF